MKTSKKKELEEKINELEKKLSLFNQEINKIDTNSKHFGNHLKVIREIRRAKDNSIERAGQLKTSDDGSVLEADTSTEIKIPTNQIHEFENLDECVCGCHNLNKKDCLECYDHPVHLNAFTKPKRESIPPKQDTLKKENWFKKWWNR